VSVIFRENFTDAKIKSVHTRENLLQEELQAINLLKKKAFLEVDFPILMAFIRSFLFAKESANDRGISRLTLPDPEVLTSIKSRVFNLY
jgi:hypothetical protein